jgi:DNA-binding FadR family transcriptional regulator
MIRRTLGTEWQELEQLLDFRQVIEQQIDRTAALRRAGADIKAIRAAGRCTSTRCWPRRSSRSR